MVTAQAQRAIWSTATEAEAAPACQVPLQEVGSTPQPRSSATETWSLPQRVPGWCQGGSRKQIKTPERRGAKRWSTERNVSLSSWPWSSVSSWCAGSLSSSPTHCRLCAQKHVPSPIHSLPFSSGSVTATPHSTRSYTPYSTKTSERPSKRFCAEAPRALSFSIQTQSIGHGHKRWLFLRQRQKESFPFIRTLKGLFWIRVKLCKFPAYKKKNRTERRSFYSHSVRRQATWDCETLVCSWYRNSYRVRRENSTWNRGRR